MNEPLRYDDVDLDTVECWRDDLVRIKSMSRMNIGTSGGAHVQLLNTLIDKINTKIADCHGFNDDHPSEEDMKSAHDCNEFHRQQQEELLE